ncbi:RNA polymerase I-specific transcription initiation factor-domain-containing protein [Xylaria sp. FL0933]|nr:RNA polymerase I-specific transcription initiation factor-domain-containing protein [Xylaria sp. FL0933]
MAYTGNDSDEYLPDSDDSNDDEEGDEEEEERPNRWTGPPSTWQQLNSAEIDTLTALNELRNRDLSVHLYNAFALKHRHQRGKTRDVAKPVTGQDVDVTTGQPVQENKWVPPNLWIAWPLPAHEVPRPQFTGRTDSADEHSTFRMQTPYNPAAELEEAVSATILRFAKERFQARQEAARRDEATVGSHHASDGEEGSDIEMQPKPTSARPKSRAKSRSKTRSVKYESTSEAEMMDIDDTHVEKTSSPTPSETLPLKTVVATDDELSYSLLRPSARGILAKLDTALAILHNAQESKYNCPSESDASSASSRSQSQSRSRSRSRGPSTMHSQSPEIRRRPTPSSRAASVARESAAPEGSASVKKRGRPKKVHPRLDGETDRAYAIRIARLQKKPIPRFSDLDDEQPISDSTPAPNSAAGYADTTNSKGKGKAKGKAPRQSRRASNADTDADSASGRTSTSGTSATPRKRPPLARTRLRDWRDILGAAALAGFPPAALDRAARRCADLFGQSFALHTLHEGPADGIQAQIQSVRYEPGMAMPPTSFSEGEGEEEWDDGYDEGVRGRISRATSAALSETESRGRGRGRGRGVTLSRNTSRSRSQSRPRSQSRSKTRSRSRSRSASSAGGSGTHFCVFSNCPRAVEPFTRRPNLVRHLQLVHGFDGGEELLQSVEDVESADEMHGAVHVDGFLRPIKVRPGWRGEDAAREKRRPMRRMGKGGERGDRRMRDVDSVRGREEE